MREWSDLPEDILHLIVERLGPKDLNQFGSICSSWSSVSLQTWFEQPQPWLMVPYPNGETNGETQGLLSLPDRKVYRLELPEVLVNVHENSKIHILYPFTRLQLQLSPLTTFPNVVDTCQLKEREVMDCHRCPFHDVIYYKGQFYAIKHAGRVLASWGPSLQAAIMVSPSKGDGFDKNYLVES
uniref:F-box domain-containing protein n=1 Tax=Nelumbo nucifera TaxID=4432 RepID=A0A822Z7K2_NELNU|nr:TPA_asm: hypothetical protein HUJ06_008119 [Nelumbo nucifera]